MALAAAAGVMVSHDDSGGPREQISVEAAAKAAGLAIETGNAGVNGVRSITATLARGPSP